MTTPKQALEAARKCIWSGGDSLATVAIIDQALSQLTASPDREKVARLWQELLDKDDRTSPEEYPDMVLITFEEFESAILSTIAPDEAAVRADEREKCAKVADERAEKLRVKAKQQTKPNGNSYFHQAIEARVIAAAIRSNQAKP